MNYQECIEYIESLSPTLGRPGLERFALFMSEAKNLQDGYPSLHVAGTNGKGSVVCMLAECLMQSGFKTGRYIGPHLMSYNERFEIDGKAIANDELARICTTLREQSEAFGKRFPDFAALTWFELLTAIGFYYFAEQSVDAAVFEVGLGGLYDATNVLSKPVVTGIVTVSLDHMHILGSTVEEIAFEKAGIIKENVPLVTACSGKALEVILAEAKKKNAPVICINDKIELSCGTKDKREPAYLERLHKRLNERCSKDENGATLIESICSRKGYQKINTAVAAVMLALWEMETAKQCLHGFERAVNEYFWPGRLQFFEKQNLILDGAHNEAGARALKEALDKLFPNKSRCFILSFYQSKQFKEILTALLRPGDRVYASSAAGRRPVIAATEVIRQATELGAQGQSFISLDQAFAAAERDCPEGAIMVATGSFATVSAALTRLGFASVEESRKQSRNF